MPEFEDLNGNTVKLEPTKLTLVSKKTAHAVVRQEGGVTRFVGIINVECDGPQAFAEIVNRMVNGGEVLNALEEAAVVIYNPQVLEDRYRMVLRIQQLYFREKYT